MEEWIRLVAAGLSARGHNVFLLGRTDSRYLQRAGKSVQKENIFELSLAGDFDPRTIARIKKILDHRSIDILCVNFNKDIRLGGIAARWQHQVKVIWSVGINIAKDKLSHRVLTPRLIDRIIVPSLSLKNELRRFVYLGDKTIDVIPIGIDDNNSVNRNDEARRLLREKYRLSSDALVAVTVGRFVYKKGHEFLIQAGPEILAHFPNLHFLFLGDGPRESELRNQVMQLKLQDRFIFAGMLDNIDLELAGADLMIHPSKEEPFGIALLEGMRAGLPIAASRVGGIPEVVRQDYNAVLFEPCCSGDIAKSVISLASDPDTMNRFGTNGRNRWRAEFQYDTMIDRVESCFESVEGETARHDSRTVNHDTPNGKLQSA